MPSDNFRAKISARKLSAFVFDRKRDRPGMDREAQHQDSSQAKGGRQPKHAAATSSSNAASGQTSWFHESSSSSSSTEAVSARPTTPTPRQSISSRPFSPTSPSSILKSPKHSTASGSGDSARSSSTIQRDSSKSVSFSNQTSVYNVPARQFVPSANNSQEELWREDVLPRRWRHEAGSPVAESFQQYPVTFSQSGNRHDSAQESLLYAEQQHHGFVRTATSGEYMLPFTTPMGVEHIRFSHAELERYNAMVRSSGTNTPPSLVEFLRALRDG